VAFYGGRDIADSHEVAAFHEALGNAYLSCARP
jgi:hypothetical protein